MAVGHMRRTTPSARCTLIAEGPPRAAEPRPVADGQLSEAPAVDAGGFATGRWGQRAARRVAARCPEARCSMTRPVVAVASEHGAGGALVAARVAEALRVPLLDRAAPVDPEDTDRLGLVDRLARASSMTAGEPVERLD